MDVDDSERDPALIKMEALRNRAQDTASRNVAKYTLALVLVVSALLIVFG